MRYLALAAAALLLAVPVSSSNTSTLKNLQLALDAESRLAAESTAYAYQAQTQNYKGMALLFRAVSTSAQVHENKMITAIKALGGKPVTMVDRLVPSGKNLNVALKSINSQLSQLVKKDYPKYIKIATQEGVRDANLAFSYSSITDKALVSLVNGVAKNKKVWGTAQIYFICSCCGYTVSKLSFGTCPVCAGSKDKFTIIQ